MGEVSEEFLKELAKKIKEKWDYLKAEKNLYRNQRFKYI